jgi:hypothetical protein
MNTETAVVDKHIRILSIVMFLASIPIAFLVYSEFFNRFNDSFVCWLKYVGAILWLGWLTRSIWQNPPRSFRVILWSASFLWHLPFIPLFLFSIFSLIPFYLAIHATIIAGYSVLLLLSDHPLKFTNTEQGTAPKP